MKKLSLLLSITILMLTSCEKEIISHDQQAELDDATIRSYLTAKNIQATKAPGGFYYQVLKDGTGKQPVARSLVRLNYTAKLIDETPINSEKDAVFQLSNVIWGWQQGIPLIRQGGEIILYVPSGLAYGNASPSGKIPANSSFIFQIELSDVTD